MGLQGKPIIGENQWCLGGGAEGLAASSMACFQEPCGSRANSMLMRFPTLDTQHFRQTLLGGGAHHNLITSGAFYAGSEICLFFIKLGPLKPAFSLLY